MSFGAPTRISLRALIRISPRIPLQLPTNSLLGAPDEFSKELPKRSHWEHHQWRVENWLDGSTHGTNCTKCNSLAVTVRTKILALRIPYRVVLLKHDVSKPNAHFLKLETSWNKNKNPKPRLLRQNDANANFKNEFLNSTRSGFISESELTFTFAMCRRPSVRLSSVCLSVTFVPPTQAIDIFGNIFISYARSFISVFWEEKRLVGATPSTWNFGLTDPGWIEIANFQPIFTRSSSAVTPSEKSTINTNRKSTTRFPMSQRWSSYVAPKSPKGNPKNAKRPIFA